MNPRKKPKSAGRRSTGGRPRINRGRLSTRRSITVFALASLVWVLIFSRLFFIQVLKGAEYKRISGRQHKQHIKLEAKRGNIYDREGRELAINLPVESFFAIPESVKSADQLAKAFSSTDSGYRQLKRDLSKRKNFVWLKRKVEKKESQKLRKRGLEGVWSIEETKRCYPHGDLGREVLGFTNIDNQGLAGVEFQYDLQLRGRDGEAVFQRDGHRNSYRVAEYPLLEPEDGKSLVLTIDIDLQSIVEQELEKGIELTQADGGSAVFMDPRTGEILAMAYCGKEDGLPVKNRTLSDNFEPGSTFKIITAAAALEEGILGPEDSIFAEEGEFQIGRKTIHDVKSYKWLSFKEGVVYSSNIVLAKIAMMLGKDRLYRYARSFGLGEKTGIDMPGEAGGSIPSPRRWPDLVLACIGFGQGISLTPLQLVCAYSAIANHGILMKPFVVKAILDQKGKTLQSTAATPVRRVVSEQTAHLLVDFMKGVVSSGSGQMAKMEGLTVGGKTGTAQKANPSGRGYLKGNYIASFIGFFPAEDPRMVGLITVDNPKKEHLGGQTAAPVFKNATERIVSLSAESILTCTAEGMQPTEIEREEYDSAAKNLPQPEPLTFDLFRDQDSDGNLLVPDVRGMTVREAVKVFASYDLPLKLKGSGIVVRQTPQPNTPVTPDTDCLLECEPR